MKELTREWVRYAEDDFSTIEQLFINGKNPPYSVVCFHSQQCVEKYLKAFLIEHNTSFDRTHNLTILIDLILAERPDWTIHRDAVGVLTNFAVMSRYPEEMYVDRKVTQNAVTIALEMRDIIRIALEI